MKLSELIAMTRAYTRDNNSLVFSEEHIKMFINQGIDRIKQYNIFHPMTYLSALTDEPILLPSQYHYMLALFAASRCYDMDERFYEGTEKRNEFESLLEDLIADIQAGTLIIYATDEDGNTYPVDDRTTDIDYVRDRYFRYNPRRFYANEDDAFEHIDRHGHFDPSDPRPTHKHKAEIEAEEAAEKAANTSTISTNQETKLYKVEGFDEV